MNYRFIKSIYWNARNLFIRILRVFIRLALKFSFSRMLLNKIYLQLSYSHYDFIHNNFSKLYTKDNREKFSGLWKVVFSGKDIYLPLKGERAWLDWDSALSIIGHDAEIKETYEWLLESENKPDLFIDIGGNYGGHSLLFLANSIDVITFEPNISCHPYFLELCSLNDVHPKLEKVALGDIETIVTIKYPKDETWLGSICREVQNSFIGDELITQDVMQKSLDSYINEFKGKIILIKIDTEGNEFNVLKGSERVIDEFNPLIIFECWRGDVRKNIYDLLSKHNYEIHSLPWGMQDNKNQTLLSYKDFLNSEKTNFISVRI